MSRKIAVAALGYMAITFTLGFVWHLIVFKDVYDSFGVYSRARPIIPMGVASMAIQGVILAGLYAAHVRAKGTARVSGAVVFALLMGLFFTSGTVLALAAKAEIAHLGSWFAYNAAFSFLQFLLAGLVLGWVFRGDRT